MGGVPRKPVIGVLCCNEVADRPVQVVASRFVLPLRTISDATVLLVPALVDGSDAEQLAAILDGLLLTGSRSHVARRTSHVARRTSHVARRTSHRCATAAPPPPHPSTNSATRWR